MQTQISNTTRAIMGFLSNQEVFRGEIVCFRNWKRAQFGSFVQVTTIQMTIQKYLNYLQLLKIKAMTVLENLCIGKATERSWVQKPKQV
jgi:hypothetical protein